MINHRYQRDFVPWEHLFQRMFSKQSAKNEFSHNYPTFFADEIVEVQKHLSMLYKVCGKNKPQVSQMSDVSKGSFSLLVATKESKFEGRTQKEGINSQIQLSYLYVPHTLFIHKGVTILWLNLQYNYRSLGLTKANFKPSLIISVICRVSFRRWYFYLIKGDDRPLLSTTSLARINSSL